MTTALFQSQANELAAFNPPTATGAWTGFGEQTALVNGKLTVVVFANNPPYLAPVPASIASQFGVAPGTLVPIQIFLMDVGAPVPQAKTQSYRLVGEFKVRLSAWDVDASYARSNAVTQEPNKDYPNLVTLATDLAGTRGPSEISGDTGTPRDRAKCIRTGEKGPVEVIGTINYIGRFDVADPSQG